MIQVVYC